MCKKDDCPIYDTCEKDVDQAYYCRKVEIFVHLSKILKKRPRYNYIKNFETFETRVLM